MNKKQVVKSAMPSGGGGAEIALISLLNNLDLNQYDVTLALLDKDD